LLSVDAFGEIRWMLEQFQPLQFRPRRDPLDVGAVQMPLLLLFRPGTSPRMLEQFKRCCRSALRVSRIHAPRNAHRAC
jgi:hypothetical protein